MTDERDKSQPEEAGEVPFRFENLAGVHTPPEIIEAAQQPNLWYSAKPDWSDAAARIRDLAKMGGADQQPLALQFAPGSEGALFDAIECLDEDAPTRPLRTALIRWMREAFAASDRLRRLLVVDAVDTTAEIGVSFNWAPFPAGVRAQVRDIFGAETFTACKATEVTNNLEPALPVGAPALVTFRVPLTQLNVWDVERLTKAIGTVLRVALEEQPTVDEAPAMAQTVPRRREALLHAQAKVFRRDRDRFQLFNDGLTFAEIATLEARRDSGETVDPAAMRGERVRHLPARERSVADSVRRMFAAVHLRPLLTPKPDLPPDDTGKPWGQRRLPEDRAEQILVVAPPPAPSSTRGADQVGTADLYAALDTLPPEVREVVRLFFGLKSGTQMTREAIGIRLGIPEEQVSTLLEAGMQHLRERLASSE